MQLYLKMASRLGQHLLRAKYKTENFGLFALYSSYFFCLLFGCFGQLLAVIEQIVSLTHSITQCWLITAFGLSVFNPKLDWEGLGLYT